MRVDSRELKRGIAVAVPACALGLAVIADESLGVHIALLGCLYAATVLVMRHFGLNEKNLHSLFLLTVAIRFGIVIFLHYSQIYPFGGARDDWFYHRVAVSIAERFRQGDISLAGLGVFHWYPVFLGGLYTVTLPEMLVGKATVVWLAGISAILLYSITREMGGSGKWAFAVGFLGCNFYPSYVFYGSLLRKDTLVIPLALSGILIIARLVACFRWRTFFLFMVVSGLLMALRIYAGFVLALAFFLSWLAASWRPRPGKTIVYGLVMVLVWGCAAHFLGYGFLGIRATRKLLDPEFISHFRESQYSIGGSAAQVESDFSSPQAFAGYYSRSFVNVLLGPLPWQIRETRHLFSLIEVIPWYFCVFLILRGATRASVLKASAPALIYGIGLIGCIALFSDNLGANTGLRMSSFLALVCLAPFGFGRSTDVG